MRSTKNMNMVTRGNYFNAVINIVKLSIGCGILALPTSTFGGGSVVSPVLNALVAGANFIKILSLNK